MEDSIERFAKQFTFVPEVINGDQLPVSRSFVLGGMGGSHLAGGLITLFDETVDMYIWRDYGVPSLSLVRARESLYIASSYSGNTEEALDFLETAHKAGQHVAVVTTGGRLLAYAQKYSLPHVVLPDTHIQPRLAIGFSLLAISYLIGHKDIIVALPKLANTLKPARIRKEGYALAQTLDGQIPVIYTSRRNLALAYNWKIKFNETGKIPAFFNVFPELNHNEMTGFDVGDSARQLSERMHVIMLVDQHDDQRIARRMHVASELFEDRGLPVTTLHLHGETSFVRVFNSLILADWTAFALAEHYKVEPEGVPMIEEFKHLIQ